MSANEVFVEPEALAQFVTRWVSLRSTHPTGYLPPGFESDERFPHRDPSDARSSGCVQFPAKAEAVGSKVASRNVNARIFVIYCPPC
jgi:hypothetical protein